MVSFGNLAFFNVAILNVSVLVYRAAAVVAFTVVLGVTAFAQNSFQDRRPDSPQDFSQYRSQERYQDRDRYNRERPDNDRAQSRGRNTPGEFDFYVLALSWSPSFCEVSRERYSGRNAQQQQCGERPFSFVVHGLWPQYERGFPRDCQVPAPRLNRAIVDSMLDLMPSSRLVFNQWDHHGTCSGLNAQDYFDAVRKARELTKIPEKFQDISSYLMVTPDEVEDAFVGANPGMSRGAVSVTCDTRRLSEVRVCMSKDFQFRDCPEVDRRSCRNDKIVMPPVRGGS